MGAVARARPGCRGRRARRALPFRSLPVDHPRRPERLLDAWATLAALAARTGSSPTRDDGLAGDLPARLRPRKERRDGRSQLERARRARDRRRLVRSRARELRLPVPDGARARRRARPPARRNPQTVGEADDVWPKPLQAPHPPIIVGGSARPSHRRRGDRIRRRVQHTRRRRGRSAPSPRDPRPCRGRGGARAARLFDHDRLRRRNTPSLETRKRPECAGAQPLVKSRAHR